MSLGLASAVHREGNAPPTVRTSVPITLCWRLPREVDARIYSFSGLHDSREHIAIRIQGDSPAKPDDVLVRVHSECLTGDVFGSARCDCGEQLVEAIEEMSRSGGIILYLRQEGRGIGLYNKLDCYALQDQGRDTFEANRELEFPDDLREYTVAAEMLEAMGVERIRLLSNNPDKRQDLERVGVVVAEQCPTGVHSTPDNLDYLKAKVGHAGHTIDLRGKA